MEIKKGDKFLCLSDIKDIDDGTGYCKGLTYKKGQVYISESDGCITNECDNKFVSWVGSITADEIFEKVPKYEYQAFRIPDDAPKSATQFKQLIEGMLDTYVRKNHDYGNSFDISLDKFGLIASVVRMGDKMNRIESLTKKEAQVKDESIRDTLLDLASYCIMTTMWMDNQKKDLI